ncbi:hypothetical protein J5N97_024335 [Dioscorea zingiberensis]|uniref:Uncharacterized protein n=1 Tax=Dioscorea zingiberensis TaxID=325984 RepID=A0A9D5C6T4_9LILI|nr:hypothetical protein J5N97_024335 [Dioscorea zingiberensis]
MDLIDEEDGLAVGSVAKCIIDDGSDVLDADSDGGEEDEVVGGGDGVGDGGLAGGGRAPKDKGEEGLQARAERRMEEGPRMLSWPQEILRGIRPERSNNSLNMQRTTKNATSGKPSLSSPKPACGIQGRFQFFVLQTDNECFCLRERNDSVMLLEWREISPRSKNSSKRLWGLPSKHRADCTAPRCEITDAKHALISWVEAESLRHLSARYCPLLPPPRSTIAAAFSSDGKTLASTHGDHTVKIIDCQTGNCLKVLSGHRRTPWVVRFHPLHPEIIASGSLDHEVRLWDAHTGDCIGSRDFYRPIASIAFHAQGEILAVASGHKLFIWHYNRIGDPSSRPLC